MGGPGAETPTKEGGAMVCHNKNQYVVQHLFDGSDGLPGPGWARLVEANLNDTSEKLRL